MGRLSGSMADCRFRLVLATLLLGVAVAKWKPTAKDEEKAAFETKLAVQHEQLQEAAKDYAKFTGQKYPGPVSLNETPEEAGYRELKSAVGERVANAFQELKRIYAKMNKTETTQISEKSKTDLVSDMIESASQDYAKATGSKFDADKIAEKDRARGQVKTFSDVMHLMESVGRDVANMNNKTFSKFKGVQKSITKMKDRGMNPDTMHLPELAESQEFDDDTLEHESTTEVADSLGIDPIDESYEEDKATAETMLDKQEHDSESIGEDGIDGEDDGDMIDDGDGEGIPL